MKYLARQRIGFVIFVVFCLGVASTTIASHANAGAPNYECIAKGVRIGIDQHREKALVRWDGHGTERGEAKNGDQNGEHLFIEIVAASGIWKVDVTGFGKVVKITGPAGELIGTCTNVAGNLVLAQRGARDGCLPRLSRTCVMSLTANLAGIPTANSWIPGFSDLSHEVAY